jgi:hypothetical protein
LPTKSNDFAAISLRHTLIDAVWEIRL